METCSISQLLCLLLTWSETRVESPGLRTLRARKQGRRISCLPGLFFLSFLPRAVGKSRPSCSVIPLCVLCSVSTPPPPPPEPSPLPPQTGAQPKEVWPRVQLGPVSCRKISSISHSTKAKVCKKKKGHGVKFLEQGLQTLHLPEEKLQPLRELLPKWTPKILFFCFSCLPWGKSSSTCTLVKKKFDGGASLPFGPSSWSSPSHPTCGASWSVEHFPHVYPAISFPQ